MRRKVRIKTSATMREQMCKCWRCRTQRHHRKPGHGKYAKRLIARRVRYQPIEPDDEG